ncbi:GTP-binding protein [Streptomyces milbemycinicus]|uniref:GTP-binding protein n=1 Tax=Streptomyces milbemycinicus TaxID=476552 RepID=UPI00340E1040
MIRFIALSGFLGAGKTTTLLAASRELEKRGRRVAVITNDQGADLVDTQLMKSQMGAVGEVTGGCFCCRFEDLMEVAQDLIDRGAADTLLAESVGSCTDLQATVVLPLKRYYGDRFLVSPLTTVVEPDRYQAFTSSLPVGEKNADLSYLFGKQLEEADIIALNKTDQLPPTAPEKITSQLGLRFPEATAIIPYSATTGTGIPDLVDAWLSTSAASAPVLSIDYDRYASAEAHLAWLNQRFDTAAVKDAHGFASETWATTALTHLSAAAAEHGWTVGHAKVTLTSGAALAKASLVAAGAEPIAYSTATETMRSAEVRFNARVACDPLELDEAVRAAVRTADEACGCASVATAAATAFRPGYPRPVHRLEA